VPQDRGPLAAAIAAGILTLGYAAGGYFRVFSGLVILAVLLIPGPGGRSMLAGILDFVTERLGG
jgi:hypothetical protein